MRRSAFQPFPATRASILASIRSADAPERERAFGALVDAYWHPVCAHVRARWRASDEDASDLTQEFFARALERDLFAAYDPARARFRTFVRVCLDRFLANEYAAAGAAKRGGNVVHVALDEHDPVEASAEALDAAFHREWVRGLFALAVADVRAWAERTGKGTPLAVFERYDLVDDDERPTYADLAAMLEIPVTTVTNALSAARRELRRAVLARLRAACATEAEFRDEARALLGVEVG